MRKFTLLVIQLIQRRKKGFSEVCAKLLFYNISKSLSIGVSSNRTKGKRRDIANKIRKEIWGLGQ